MNTIHTPENYRKHFVGHSQAIDAHRQVIDALRLLNQHSVTLNADASELNLLAQELNKLAARCESLQSHRLREYFNPLTELASGEGMQPYSPFGGSHSPISPPIHYQRDGDKIIAQCAFGLTHEGPPSMLHGGVIAGIYDCVMGAAMVAKGVGGPTKELCVQYHAPTPLNTTLTFEAEVVRIDGRKIFIEGSSFADQQLLSTATAVFINRLG